MRRRPLRVKGRKVETATVTVLSMTIQPVKSRNGKRYGKRTKVTIDECSLNSIVVLYMLHSWKKFKMKTKLWFCWEIYLDS